MPAGTKSPAYRRVIDEYIEQINTETIPQAMSNLWKNYSYPKKIGVDSEGHEPLLLWGLNLVQRRDGYNPSYYTSYKEFTKCYEGYGYRYTDELYYRSFIDVRARLWVPISESLCRYDSDYVGPLRRFMPESCISSHELANWDAVLKGC